MECVAFCVPLLPPSIMLLRVICIVAHIMFHFFLLPHSLHWVDMPHFVIHSLAEQLDWFWFWGIKMILRTHLCTSLQNTHFHFTRIPIEAQEYLRRNYWVIW